MTCLGDGGITIGTNREGYAWAARRPNRKSSTTLSSDALNSRSLPFSTAKTYHPALRGTPHFAASIRLSWMWQHLRKVQLSVQPTSSNIRVLTLPPCGLSSDIVRNFKDEWQALGFRVRGSSFSRASRAA